MPFIDIEYFVASPPHAKSPAGGTYVELKGPYDRPWIKIQRILNTDNIVNVYPAQHAPGEPPYQAIIEVLPKGTSDTEKLDARLRVPYTYAELATCLDARRPGDKNSSALRNEL